MINQSCRYLMLIENHICCNGNDKPVEIYLQYLYHSCSSFSVLDSPELLGFILCVISSYSARLDSTESRIHVLRFHACLDSTKSCIHSLFMGPTILFTHLKIILLQCFQFSVSATISSIQTDP